METMVNICIVYHTLNEKMSPNIWLLLDVSWFLLLPVVPEKDAKESNSTKNAN